MEARGGGRRTEKAISFARLAERASAVRKEGKSRSRIKAGRQAGSKGFIGGTDVSDVSDVSGRQAGRQAGWLGQASTLYIESFPVLFAASNRLLASSWLSACAWMELLRNQSTN